MSGCLFFGVLFWEIVLLNKFWNFASDAKAAICGISIFHLNVIIIVIWKVIFHVTETFRCPSDSSMYRYCIIL